MKPQSRDVLELLRAKPNGVTQREAIVHLACYRLAARVADLRAEGFPIVAESVVQGGVRFARYRLVVPATAEQLPAFDRGNTVQTTWTKDGDNPLHRTRTDLDNGAVKAPTIEVRA